MIRNLLLAATAFALAACARNGNLYDEAKVTSAEPVATTTPPEGLALTPYYEAKSETLTQGVRNMKYDILADVDNSGSMTTRLADLEGVVSRFTSVLSARGIDYRIGTVRNTEPSSGGAYLTALQGPNRIIASTQADAATRLAQNFAAQRTSYAGADERPVVTIRGALADPANADFFRSGARHAYWVISDAIDLAFDGDSAAISAFATGFRSTFDTAAPAGWMMTTIGTSPTQPCPDAEFSSQPLIQALTFLSGGEMGPVCSVDPGALVEDSARALVSRATELSLTTPPGTASVDDASLSVKVGGTSVARSDASGFHWNLPRAAISFPGTVVPSVGQSVEVGYDLVY